MTDILDLLIAGANRDLRIYVRTSQLCVGPVGLTSPEEARFSRRLGKVRIQDAIIAKEELHPPPRHSMQGSRTAFHPVRVNPEPRSVPIEHTLCRANASGRNLSQRNK